MDINKFTGTLASRLEAAGADRESAQRETKAFISSMPAEEASRLASLGDNEEMMKRITSSLMRRIEASRAQQQHTPAVRSADDDDDDDMIDEMLASSRPMADPRRQQPAPRQSVQPQPVQQRQVQPQAQQRQPAQLQPQPQAQQRQPHAGQSQRQQPVPRQPVPRQGQRQTPAQAPSSQKPRTAKTQNDKEESERRVIYKPDPNADYRKFYMILACTFPLWGFAALLCAAAFVFAIGALSVSIVLIIVALFGGVAVGTMLAVVGIIYGITQLFEYSPIGMYEIGLGVMIGGGVMFSGILAYNIAVRLIPYLIKQVMVLLSFTIHKCVELYYYVKGRCADL